jgi:hypothetical protein
MASQPLKEKRGLEFERQIDYCCRSIENAVGIDEQWLNPSLDQVFCG